MSIRYSALTLFSLTLPDVKSLLITRRQTSRQLLKDPHVVFAGYKVPHPLEHKFVLRVQTTAEYLPQDAITNAISDLVSELSFLEEKFKVRVSRCASFSLSDIVHTLTGGDTRETGWNGMSISFPTDRTIPHSSTHSPATSYSHLTLHLLSI